MTPDEEKRVLSLVDSVNAIFLGIGLGFLFVVMVGVFAVVSSLIHG